MFGRLVYLLSMYFSGTLSALIVCIMHRTCTQKRPVFVFGRGACFLSFHSNKNFANKVVQYVTSFFVVLTCVVPSPALALICFSHGVCNHLERVLRPRRQFLWVVVAHEVLCGLFRLCRREECAQFYLFLISLYTARE